MANDVTTEAAERSADQLDAGPTDAHSDAELVEDELLVEEVSIDGMCGVY